MYVEQPTQTLENGDFRKNFDDDGRTKRTGTDNFMQRYYLVFSNISFFFFFLINELKYFCVWFWNIEGTLLTASAHIITAVIGSGVLSLAWAIAQLGWVAGPAVLMAFSFITYFTSTLLADSYRSPDPVTGKRNYTYMDVVRANLGTATHLLS